VYAGGGFDAIGGQARENIGAIDATTGTATGWNPGADSGVRTLAIAGQNVYAGGRFTEIGGRRRDHIAALDATTGAATDWNPNANGSGLIEVSDLALAGQTVYAAGRFTSIGGQRRQGIAALDATTGAATGWDPGGNRFSGQGTTALLVSGQTVYAGGQFTRIGGRARNHIAALDATTGAATRWNPDAGVNGFVGSLAISGQEIFAGGSFTAIGGEPRSDLAAIDATTGTASGWRPDANRPVLALDVGPDGSLWAGGEFSGFRSKAQQGIARFRPVR
jgi:hypothetical protein